MAKDIENDRKRKLVLGLLRFLHHHSFVVVCKFIAPFIFILISKFPLDSLTFKRPLFIHSPQ